jgi:hypothetical protein
MQSEACLAGCDATAPLCRRPFLHGLLWAPDPARTAFPSGVAQRWTMGFGMQVTGAASCGRATGSPVASNRTYVPILGARPRTTRMDPAPPVRATGSMARRGSARAALLGSDIVHGTGKSRAWRARSDHWYSGMAPIDVLQRRETHEWTIAVHDAACATWRGATCS